MENFVPPPGFEEVAPDSQKQPKAQYATPQGFEEQEALRDEGAFKSYLRGFANSFPGLESAIAWKHSTFDPNTTYKQARGNFDQQLVYDRNQHPAATPVGDITGVLGPAALAGPLSPGAQIIASPFIGAAESVNAGGDPIYGAAAGALSSLAGAGIGNEVLPRLMPSTLHGLRNGIATIGLGGLGLEEASHFAPDWIKEPVQAVLHNPYTQGVLSALAGAGLAHNAGYTALPAALSGRAAGWATRP